MQSVTQLSIKVMHHCAVEHDFNGHEVNGIHEVYGKSATAEPFI